MKRESIEWCNIWIAGANETRLPRILLVGDSIAQSYYPEVERLLKDRFFVARLTTSRCLCDAAFKKELRLVLDDYDFAFIHFNNGLHGWDYSEALYGKALPRIVEFIRQRAPRSSLILATSTPVRKVGALAEFDPRTDRVQERNRLLRAAASAADLSVDDLFEVVKDHAAYHADDGVHFNAQGQAALAQQVVLCLSEATR